MFKIFYPEKDASLFESLPTLNSGLDEILSIGNYPTNLGLSLARSRSVVKFDINEIQNALTKYSASISDCKFLLKLYTSHAKSLPSNYTIESKLLYGSWENGTGFENSTPYRTDGISWQYPKSGSAWIASGSLSGSINVTGSFGGSYVYDQNSQFYLSQSINIEPTQSFTYRTADIELDVTGQIRFLSEYDIVDNNGFLIKLDDVTENSNQISVIKFFSRETHTIYVPKLIMLWDNSESTGSLEQISLESFTVYPKMKHIYKDTEIAKIRFYARDKYPQKSATNLFPLTNVKKLPSSTYYSITDALTDETIIPFDNIYSKVSVDETSNFIYLDMNGLMPERYYKIALKIVDGFEEQYIDNEFYFKVVR